MIIRVRGAKGACRVEVEPGEPATKLFEQASAKLRMGSMPFGLARDPKGKDQISVNAGSIALAGLKYAPPPFPLRHSNLLLLLLLLRHSTPV